MTLSILESLDRDIWNWREAVLKTSYGMNWSTYLPKNITKEQVQDETILRPYLEKQFYATGKVITFRKWLNEHLNIRQIESDLEDLMGRTFQREDITVYLTTFQRAPYEIEKNYFFLTVREMMPKVALTAIYHELMHFLFHWHYWDECAKTGLSEGEIHDFKESLTVLLNPLLEKRGLAPDRGYPKHKALRAQWVALYEQERNFSAFIKKALPLYKQTLTY
jgi:hypothetical protein